jgi:hypothetical protein
MGLLLRIVMSGMGRSCIAIHWKTKIEPTNVILQLKAYVHTLKLTNPKANLAQERTPPAKEGSKAGKRSKFQAPGVMIIKKKMTYHISSLNSTFSNMGQKKKKVLA